MFTLSLVRDLVRGALTDRAAVADVRSLRALAHDDEVDLARVRKRARRARVEPGRTQVHVVVELEAQLQQQPSFDVGVRQTRVAGLAADRAEQDRVVRADRVQVLVGERVARLQVPRRAERERGLLEGHVAAGGDRVEHLLRLRDDLRTDAVTGDDGQLHDTGHDAPCESMEVEDPRLSGAGDPHARMSAPEAAPERERGDHSGTDRPGIRR